MANLLPDIILLQSSLFGKLQGNHAKGTADVGVFEDMYNLRVIEGGMKIKPFQHHYAAISAFWKSSELA